MAQWGRILPVKEMQVLSLGRKDPLEKEMTTHSSILDWESPWTEEPGGLQSMVSQKNQTQLSNHTTTVTTNLIKEIKICIQNRT